MQNATSYLTGTGLAFMLFSAVPVFAARTPATDISFAARLPTAAVLGLPHAGNDHPAGWAALPGAGLEAEFGIADTAMASR
ncbi:MAG TPA: hypothetical protein VGP48_07455 [Stellaceae bacterium]|jgi:hypothetical protein|nr:hypothetical protein [Stellaceae bacterium]